MSVLAMLKQTGGLGRHRRIQSRPDERSPVSATGAADTEPTMSASLVTAIHPPALNVLFLVALSSPLYRCVQRWDERAFASSLLLFSSG